MGMDPLDEEECGVCWVGCLGQDTLPEFVGWWCDHDPLPHSMGFGPGQATRDQELSLEPKISQSPSLSLTFVLTFS